MNTLQSVAANRIVSHLSLPDTVMERRLRALSLSVMLFATSAVFGHGDVKPQPQNARAIEFPDTAQYKTLALDLHTHSVFSDGHVWPTIRVEEAQRDGLQGVAITEHLEWQPHIADIPHGDRNRSFEEASRAAATLDLAVIPGVEITRLGDPGHINAVFVKDANPLVEQRHAQTYVEGTVFATQEEALAASVQNAEIFRGAHQIQYEGKAAWAPFVDPQTYFTLVNYQHAVARGAESVVEAANEQGAFLFWNHPDFASTKAPLNKFHAKAVKKGWLHGIEIANGDRYYPNAHRLALKHDLALIGVSDVHDLIAWDYRPDAAEQPGHRPVTLIFATEDSPEAMREALFARRTAVFWKDSLMARPAEMTPLLESIVQLTQVRETSWGIVATLQNTSSALIRLRNDTGLPLRDRPQSFELPPLGTIEVSFNMDKPKASQVLNFAVINAFVAPNKPAKLVLRQPAN